MISRTERILAASAAAMKTLGGPGSGPHKGAANAAAASQEAERLSAVAKKSGSRADHDKASTAHYDAATAHMQLRGRQHAEQAQHHWDKQEEHDAVMKTLGGPGSGPHKGGGSIHDAPFVVSRSVVDRQGYRNDRPVKGHATYADAVKDAQSRSSKTGADHFVTKGYEGAILSMHGEDHDYDPTAHDPLTGEKR